MINKTLGSIFVAAGTAIGAAMFALPLVSAGMGLGWSLIAFLGVWAVMWMSGLYTLEVCLAFKAPANHYPTMALATLGRWGQLATNLAYLLLLYALIASYISGGGSILGAMTLLAFDHSLPAWANSLIFTMVIAVIVTWSTRALDYTNRGLFIFKLALLGLVFALFLPQIDLGRLIVQHESQFIWAALPVIITGFGGVHIVIPSLAQYLNEDVTALKKVLLYGSLLPLIVYLLWLAMLFGALPLEGAQSFSSLAQIQANVSDLMLAINLTQDSPLLSPSINLFGQLAFITSFLGVSLGLFDFLRDKKHQNTPRALTGLITFVPPLIVVFFYPNAFMKLLAYASFFVAIILIIIPAFMAYRLRRSDHLKSPYRAPGGDLMIGLVVLAGLGFIVITTAQLAGVLPVWTGV
jgi:aromatic amino acid transport protein